MDSQNACTTSPVTSECVEVSDFGNSHVNSGLKRICSDQDFNAKISKSADSQPGLEKVRVCSDYSGQINVEEHSSLLEVDAGALPEGSEGRVTQEQSVQLRLSRGLFRKLKDAGHPLRMQLNDLGCSLLLGSKSSRQVTISGSSSTDVQVAEELFKNTKTPHAFGRLTHFVSVRLTASSIQQKFIEFMDSVLRYPLCCSDEDADGTAAVIPPELFQKPEKLPMSLVMLSLPDEEAEAKATRVLREALTECRSLPDVSGAPLRVRLSSPQVFGHPKRARVMFVTATPSEPLQTVAERVHSHLCAAELGKPERRGVTLHVTLMNTTFVTRLPRKKKLKSFWNGFNASGLLCQYADLDLGEASVDAFEISSLFGKDDSNYYKPASVVHLSGEMSLSGGESSGLLE